MGLVFRPEPVSPAMDEPIRARLGYPEFWALSCSPKFNATIQLLSITFPLR